MDYKHFNEAFMKKLQDKKTAQAYLEATLAECEKMDKKQAQKHLINTLKIMRKAQGSWVFDNMIGNFFYRIMAFIILKWYKSSHA